MKLTGTNYIALFHKGSMLKIENTDPRYKRAAKLLEQNKFDDYVTLYHTDPVAQVIKEIPKEIVEFRIENGKIYFGKFEVRGALATKIESILREDLDWKPFANFVRRLLQNPSERAVNELYNFLGYKELAITDDGYFLGYKGVRDDYYSQHGNLQTVVLKGKVDEIGRIYNGIGEEIEVQRNCVNEDKNVHCSHGLHVGSLDYARDFSKRMVVVKVDPQHVVSVPTDANFQKLRVCAYSVVADFVAEIASPVANVEKGKIVEKAGRVAKPTKEQTKKVTDYLAKKAAEEYEYVSVKSVSNSFSPEYVPRAFVIDIAKSIGYKVEDGWIYL